MTAPPLVVRPADELADVVSVMLEARVRSVPVVDGRRVVGVVSRRDVVRLVARGEYTAGEVRRRRGLPDGEPAEDGSVRDPHPPA